MKSKTKRVWQLLLFSIITISCFSTNAQHFDWATSIGGSNAYVHINSSCIDKQSGSIVATGDFSGMASFGTSIITSNSSTDVFVAKYYQDGSFQWAVSFGGTNAEIAYSIATDAAGNIYITGSFLGSVDFDPGAGTTMLTSVGASDVFFAKFDGLGNFIWAKNVGSVYDDIGYDVEVDASGSVFITGYYHGPVADFDPGAGTASVFTCSTINNVFFAKYDTNGNYVWAKGICNNGSSWGSRLKLDLNGNIILSGNFMSSPWIPATDFDPGAGTYSLSSIGSRDVFFAKYDPVGNLVWVKSFGSADSEEVGDLDLDSIGNIYITGSMNDFVDFNPAGASGTLGPAGFDDIYLAKYDNNGNYIWANMIGGTAGNDRGFGLEVNHFGDVYFTGVFSSGTVDFDAGAGVNNLTSPAGNAYDVFISKYSTDGNHLWAKCIGGGYWDQSFSVSVDTCGIYVSGWFGDDGEDVDFDPDTGVFEIEAEGYDDGYILKLAQLGILNVIADSIICENDSVAIEVDYCGALQPVVFVWNGPGGWVSALQNPFISQFQSTQNGMYYITITDASGAIATDSIYIGITHLNPNIAVSASYNPICIGDSLVLTGTGGISYIWSTTDTTNTIQVAPPSTQTYYVTGTDGICFNEDSIIIDVVPMPIVGITGDSILCFGDQVQITASGGGDYLWNNSSTNASISVSPTVSQYYFVTVSSPPCMVVDSFFVLVNPLPVAFAGYDTAITIGAEAPLHGSGGIYYEWTPSFDLSCSICPNPTATPNETTTYWLTVANEFGCIDEDNVVVEVFCGNVFFPNAFSPNGDINNGEFKVQGNCIKSIDIKIFNRWGDLLFETNNLENSWDGIYNGLLVPTDVYTYKYSCQFITGEHKSGSGSIIVFY